MNLCNADVEVAGNSLFSAVSTAFRLADDLADDVQQISRKTVTP
jgi:hypothetical protein